MKKFLKELKFFFAVFFVWTLFFSVSSPVLALENSFDYVSGINYEPIAKLVNFLNDKKSELEKLGDSFTKSNTVRHRVSNPNNAKARTPFLLSAVLGSVKDTVVSKSKQYFGKVFCVAKDFVFPGACQSETDQDYATATDQQEKTSAEDISAIKQQYDDAIAEANILNQKFNALKLELGKIKAGGVVIKEPIIEQKTVERTIEKIISGLSQDDLSAGIASIRTELSNLNTNLTNQINNLSSNTSRQSTATFQAISLTNRIDSLTGVRLSGITINGVSGLTDSDIPDTITASNYLPLSGGTISGDLTIIGNATLGVITLQNATAGYFTATSTTASIFPYASTTALTVSGNSYLGTVSSGLWSGTTIAVNKGGTGQTSFGQGWLNSDGTTLSASTSPTVNYIVATSTRSSIFPYASTTALTVSGTGYFGNISNTGGYTQSGTSENTFTGTPTFSNATYSALFTGGNVGVGTTSPDSQAKLHVDGGVSNALRITGSTQGRLLIEDTGATANQKLWEWMSDGGLLQASLIDDAQSNRITYLTINNSGNIGIGTTSPNWKLSVSGQGSFDDFVRASYLTATSTTATSTFPLLKATTAFQLGTDYLTDITGTGLQITNSALTLNATGDWTGTFDGQDGTYYLSRANHTGTQNVSTLSNYDWTFANNYGTGNLTASSSSIALWARGGINASSTSHFVYASTTALSVSGNSYLGTVSSGIWNGSSIGDAYIDDTITLTNLTQITNRAISDTTGTLTVARGGTGQTSFGQGWLNSDGSTLSASTSPTVNYITATSTTATSTLTDLNFPATANIFYGGQRFLTASTTAAGNLTIGYQSATNIDANGGLYNTGLGYQAMGNATSTSYNTAVGYQALKGSATISGIGYNTAVGYQSLYSNTTGINNTVLGYKALVANSTGNYNTANGFQTLQSNTTGSQNNAYGWISLSSNISGSSNNAYGMYSLLDTTASNNTAFGHASFMNNTTGTGNIGLGYYTGRGDGTTADQRSVIDNYMTFIGYQASRDSSIASTTALTNGTAIGKNARVAQSNAIVLGGTGSDAVNVAIGTTSPWAKLSILNTYGSIAPLFDVASSTSAAYATSSIFRINADGKIGIGTTSPAWKLSVAGIGSFDDFVRASYFKATSTTASTFPYASTTALTASGTGYFGALSNTGGYTQSGTTANTFTGTPTFSNATYSALFTGGNVGIGTATPGNKLDVQGAGNSTLLNLSASSLGTGYVLGQIVNTGGITYFGADTSNGGTFTTSLPYASIFGSFNANPVQFISNALPRLTILSAGNVGIGTTTPNNILDIYSTTKSAIGFSGASGSTYKWTIGQDISNGGRFSIASSTALGTLDRFVIDGNGNIGVGITPVEKFSVLVDSESTVGGVNIAEASDGTPGSKGYMLNIDINTAANYPALRVNNLTTGVAFVVLNDGDTGVGTSSPWRKLGVTGTVGFDGLTTATGSGSLCLTSTTNKEVVYNAADTCLPSLRSTKHDINNLDLSGLDIIKNLQPVSFVYNKEYGDDRARYGFIAEDTAAVNPHLASYNGAVLSGIDDRAILSVAVKAIQEMNLKVVDLQASVAVSSGTGSDGLFSWIVGKFMAMFGISFGENKIRVDNFEMKDSATGETYCVKISNGDWSKIKGVCGSSSSSTVSSMSSSSSVVSSSSSSLSSSAESSSSSSVVSSSSADSSSSSSSSTEASSSSAESSSSSSEASSSSSSEASSSSVSSESSSSFSSVGI